MIVVDASLLLAFLAEGDPHHRASVEVLADGDDFLAHTMTLAESLVRGERDGRGAELVTRFVQLGVEEAGRVPDEPLRLARLRVETRLPLPDCCVLLTAEDRAASMATFDARLARAAEERGIEVVRADG